MRSRAENQCSICRCVKLPSDFYIGTKNGVSRQLSKCKACAKISAAADREKRADKIKARALEKKEEIAEYQKRYREANRSRLSDFYKRRHQERKKDPSFKDRKKEAARKRRAANPLIGVKESIATRLGTALAEFGNGRKKSKTLAYIGCSIEELRTHLESQFQKGMNWENRGKFGWHIDHIIPCSAFDHSDDSQVRQCWHFTNLRPMWWQDNLSKGKKITKPQMSLLL